MQLSKIPPPGLKKIDSPVFFYYQLINLYLVVFLILTHKKSPQRKYHPKKRSQRRQFILKIFYQKVVLSNLLPLIICLFF